MTERERATFQRLRAKYNKAHKERHRKAGEVMTAHIVATTVVPFDPEGARRFAELDRALREGRA